jgi:hypothetical protein
MFGFPIGMGILDQMGPFSIILGKGFLKVNRVNTVFLQKPV